MVPNSTKRVVKLTDARHAGKISRGGEKKRCEYITWQNYRTHGMVVQTGVPVGSVPGILGPSQKLDF